MFSSVQFSRSVMSDSLWPHGQQHARPPCPSRTPGIYSNSCPLSRWCHPTISSSVVPSLPTFNLSQHQGLFKWVTSSHQVAKVLEFNFNISPSNEHSGLISFRMDWLDFLAVQGILKSLLQHHSSKASILWCSAFFIVQLSHPYMTTGKTIALTRWTFAGKVMSLLFQYAVWVGHSFSSKEQESFNFMAAVTICSDFGAQKHECHCYHHFPIYLPWNDGIWCHHLCILTGKF